MSAVRRNGGAVSKGDLAELSTRSGRSGADSPHCFCVTLFVQRTGYKLEIRPRQFAAGLLWRVCHPLNAHVHGIPTKYPLTLEQPHLRIGYREDKPWWAGKVLASRSPAPRTSAPTRRNTGALQVLGQRGSQGTLVPRRRYHCYHSLVL